MTSITGLYGTSDIYISGTSTLNHDDIVCNSVTATTGNFTNATINTLTLINPLQATLDIPDNNVITDVSGGQLVSLQNRGKSAFIRDIFAYGPQTNYGVFKPLFSQTATNLSMRIGNNMIYQPATLAAANNLVWGENALNGNSTNPNWNNTTVRNICIGRDCARYMANLGNAAEPAQDNVFIGDSILSYDGGGNPNLGAGFTNCNKNVIIGSGTAKVMAGINNSVVIGANSCNATDRNGLISSVVIGANNNNVNVGVSAGQCAIVGSNNGSARNGCNVYGSLNIVSATAHNGLSCFGYNNFSVLNIDAFNCAFGSTNGITGTTNFFNCFFGFNNNPTQNTGQTGIIALGINNAPTRSNCYWFGSNHNIGQNNTYADLIISNKQTIYTVNEVLTGTTLTIAFNSDENVYLNNATITAIVMPTPLTGGDSRYSLGATFNLIRSNSSATSINITVANGSSIQVGSSSSYTTYAWTSSYATLICVKIGTGVTWVLNNFDTAALVRANTATNLTNYPLTFVSTLDTYQQLSGNNSLTYNPNLSTLTTPNLTVGTGIILPNASIADTYLSSNVSLKNASNTYGAGTTQTVVNLTATGTLTLPANSIANSALQTTVVLSNQSNTYGAGTTQTFVNLAATGTLTLPANSIADIALSTNIPLKNASNSFTGATNTFLNIDYSGLSVLTPAISQNYNVLFGDTTGGYVALCNNANLIYNPVQTRLTTTNLSVSNNIDYGGLAVTTPTTGTYRMLFGQNSLAYTTLNDNASLTYNPATQVLTSPNVTANIGITGISTNVAFRVLFTNGVGFQTLNNSTSMTYNPSTQTLAVPNLSVSTGTTVRGVWLQSQVFPTILSVVNSPYTIPVPFYEYYLTSSATTTHALPNITTAMIGCTITFRKVGSVGAIINCIPTGGKLIFPLNSTTSQTTATPVVAGSIGSGSVMCISSTEWAVMS